MWSGYVKASQIMIVSDKLKGDFFPFFLRKYIITVHVMNNNMIILFYKIDEHMILSQNWFIV